MELACDLQTGESSTFLWCMDKYPKCLVALYTLCICQKGPHRSNFPFHSSRLASVTVSNGKGQLFWGGKHVFWVPTNANLYCILCKPGLMWLQRPKLPWGVMHLSGVSLATSLLSQLFGVFLAWDNNITNPILLMHVQLRSAELIFLN